MNKQLSSDEIKIINQHLNSDGKLTCIKSFKVAKLLNIKLENMMSVANSLNIKISDCELGVFGDKPLSSKNDVLYNKILKNNNMDKNIKCKTLWNEAKKSTMKDVRSTVCNSDIFVTYCQLGCFIERKNRGKDNERKSQSMDQR